MDVRKSVLVGHSADEMFDVIEAAERYPEFLPWCAGATIVSRDADEVVADIEVDFHGVRFDFRTRNPKRRPTWMAIELERGPFRRFGGTWTLTPLAADGCRVDFELHYDFDSTPLARVARPVFDRIANTLVDRFIARADKVAPTREPFPVRLPSYEPPPAPAVGQSPAPVMAPTPPATANAGPPSAPNPYDDDRSDRP